jgi:hypothetical protein
MGFKFNFTPLTAGHPWSANSSAVLMLWIVGGLFVAFALYLVIDLLIASHRRRRAAAGASVTNGSAEPALEISPKRDWSNYLPAACCHCAKPLCVPKDHRFKPFHCPACNQVNPPLKKDLLAPLKRFLRWLFYPSFQNLF